MNEEIVEDVRGKLRQENYGNCWVDYWWNKLYHLAQRMHGKRRLTTLETINHTFYVGFPPTYEEFVMQVTRGNGYIKIQGGGEQEFAFNPTEERELKTYIRDLLVRKILSGDVHPL